MKKAREVVIFSMVIIGPAGWLLVCVVAFNLVAGLPSNSGAPRDRSVRVPATAPTAPVAVPNPAPTFTLPEPHPAGG